VNFVADPRSEIKHNPGTADDEAVDRAETVVARTVLMDDVEWYDKG
jgi:hypothetical protein